MSVEFLPISNSEVELSVDIEVYTTLRSMLLFLDDVTMGLKTLEGLFDFDETL